jgi:hypothetical protein
MTKGVCSIVEEVKIFTVFGDVQELFDVKVILFFIPIVLFQIHWVFNHKLTIADHLIGISPP